MPKYTVSIEQTITYLVDVEISDIRDAREAASSVYLASKDPANDFRWGGESFDTKHVYGQGEHTVDNRYEKITALLRNIKE